MDDIERESVPAIQILLVSFNRSNDTNECAGTTASMFSPAVCSRLFVGTTCILLGVKN